jgi:hypothetical protein
MAEEGLSCFSTEWIWLQFPSEYARFVRENSGHRDAKWYRKVGLGGAGSCRLTGVGKAIYKRDPEG